MGERPPDPKDPSDGTAGVPPMPAPPVPSSYPPAITPPPVPRGSSVTRQRAGTLVTIGGVLVVIGVFLPWVTASGPGVSASLNGIKIGTFGTLILGAFAIARGLSMIRPSSFGFSLGTPLIGGILIAILMALRWGHLQDEVKAAEAVGLSASMGIGVWSVVAGTALILIGGLLAQRRS
jgi:hypothetical protein